MSTLKSIDNIQTVKTALYQLIDIVQSDVSGSDTRRSYDVFVTSSRDQTGALYSVTSSLFQTVHDQDYTLQVANPIFDMTVGLYHSSSTVLDSKVGEDVSGKFLFNSSSMMMREKIDVYKMHAGKLLGDTESAFYSPFYDSSSSSTHARIDEAIFLDFKRLFTRDRLKKESFAMRFYSTGTIDGSSNAGSFEKTIFNTYTGSNVNDTSEVSPILFTDIMDTDTSTPDTSIGFGGEVGMIRHGSDASRKVGLIFYDAGIVVLDAKKVMWADQHVSGVISATTSSIHGINTTIIGSTIPGSNKSAKFIPDFFVSASIDDIVDHISSCRFSSGSYTGITFQNQTTINSSLIFCKANAEEFNYSTNPTYVDEQGKINVVSSDVTGLSEERSFTFPTTVGLYDANGNLLAVAKMSRPIEKNYEKDLTLRIRLDF